jgi:hypothetical protein
MLWALMKKKKKKKKKKKNLLEAWIGKCGRKFTYVLKSGMNPRRDTPTGEGAVST